MALTQTPPPSPHQANLSEADAARVLEIQQQLGVTPRGSIKAQNVREVRAAFAAFAAANPHPYPEPPPLTLRREP